MKASEYEIYLLARRAMLNKDKLSAEEIRAAREIIADAMDKVSPSMRALMEVENELLAHV